MNAFHISDEAGDVVLEHVAFVGPVRDYPNGCHFRLVCVHFEVEVYSTCSSPNPSPGKLAVNKAWFNDRRTALIDAINLAW